MQTREWCAQQWGGNKSGWLKSRLYALMLEAQKTTKKDVPLETSVSGINEEHIANLRGLF
jgi:hypothetical protein